MAKVVVVDPIHDAGIKILLAAGMEVLLPQRYPDPAEIESLLLEGEGIIVRTYPLRVEVLERCKKLKVIAKHGVGVDNIDVRWATERKIPVIFTPGAATSAVAEQAITLMLAVAKKIVRCDAEVRKNNYYFRDSIRTLELSGKVLGLIGSGRIGSMVGRIGHYGFNMEVLVYDPYLSDQALIADWGRQVATLEELLGAADFISIHCPLTPETRGLINSERLRRMKKTAILVNTARGPVIDGPALYQALKEGWIAGAGLDVFPVEPPPAEEPLLELDNIVVSPHMGAVSEDAMIRMATTAARGVIAVLQGQRPEHMVNPEIYRE
ncbi:MAG: hydroxyacid dehydrogenase [Moorella sp. (in: firmicutes)]